MDKSIQVEGTPTLEAQVARAQAGDRAALESLVAAVQKDVYALALRFLWHPQDAEDAAQEILIRIITKLGSYHGKSAFRTWVYRVACNTLLTIGKKRMERHAMSFEQFGGDLAHGLTDAPVAVPPEVEEALLLEEVKVGCTLAMLLCLDRDHRLAYIIGEIIDLNHKEASQILQISPATYRKRLSRARADISAFMQARCGLVNPANACRCRRRVNTAIALGRMDPHHLLFASSAVQAGRFPKVLSEIRTLEEVRRSAALYRSHPVPEPAVDFVTRVKGLLAAKNVLR